MSHQRRHAAHGSQPEQNRAKEVVNKYVCDAGTKRVSECPSHQGCSGLLWAFPELKILTKKDDVRMYGFEGDAGQEGEGWTRIIYSSYRRNPCYRF